MLKGKIIINTRPTGSEDLIGTALKKLGAVVLSMPLIEIFPINISQEVQLAITENATFQWLVFTSRNGVESLFNQLDLSKNTEILPFKTAVFGSRTAMALQEKEFTPDLVVHSNTSADLLHDLLPQLQSSEKVLLVLGNMASNLLEDGLISKVKVERLNVYRTAFVSSVDPNMINRIKKNRYDLILFTSPSGFKSFRDHTSDEILLRNLKIACLGPTTEEIILNAGLVPLIVAKPSGKIGLIKGMENYFAKSQYENV